MIMFDLGNVLVNFDHNLAINKIKHSTNIDLPQAYQLFFDSELTASFEEGRMIPIDFYAAIKEKLNLKISYQEFVPIWNEIFFLTENNIKIQNLVDKLKQNFILVLVSNINVLHYNYLIKQYEIFRQFSRHILSYEVGARKPSPLIYKSALSVLGVEPQEAIYIDDRQDLVEAASKLGIHSICFNDYALLDKKLSNFLPEYF